MKRNILTCAALIVVGGLGFAGEHRCHAQNWGTPVFKDDFKVAVNGVPNPANWVYKTGTQAGELQTYTNSSANAILKPFGGTDGCLFIIARKDRTSAKVYTKQSWTYGRMEVRAILPKGNGVWPAIWMLPKGTINYGPGQPVSGYNFWPDNGEIDIMESLGHTPSTIHASLHNHNRNGSAGNPITGTTRITANDPTVSFNTYTVEWRPTQIDFFVNQVKVLSQSRDGLGWQDWPFNQDYSLLLNIALGGWGLQPGTVYSDSVCPQQMVVDYVRFYKMNSTPFSGIPSSIPGRVEAENYDRGGEGFAYHDNDAANLGGRLRSDGVDIEPCTDPNAPNFHVGWVQQDEWMTYTVNVTQSGEYGMTLRVATPGNGAKVEIEVDDRRVAADVAIPNTGGWQQWQDKGVVPLSLSAGTHKIRVLSTGVQEFNLNYIDFWKTQ